MVVTQHFKALFTFSRKAKGLVASCLLLVFGNAYAAPIYYNPWHRVPVASAELACLGAIDFFKNNPPNTYIDWSFDSAKFYSDFDSRIPGANGNYFSGQCRMLHTNPQVGTGDFYLPFEVVCLTGYIVVKKDSSVAQCITQGLNLTLTPAPNQSPPDPRPADTVGRSTLELIAKVTENGSPKAGVAVTFAVTADYSSGGHSSHSGMRPTGSVPVSGVTDANGEFKFQYQAGQFSGTEKITATCDTCSNKTAAHDLTVKVPDLTSLPADSTVPPRYELAGNTSAVGVKHKGNHYFTASALNNLSKLIDHYNSFAWQPVAVNDASIIWGGWFDIYSNWAGSHAEHRIGEEVDLGFLVGTNASKIKRGYDEVCKDKKVEIPSSILWHDIPKPAGKYDPHFHVRLSGSYTKGPSAGKYAPCKSDSGTK